MISPPKIQIVHQYIPAIQSKIPSYGISVTEDGIIMVFLAECAPSELFGLLAEELRRNTTGDLTPPSMKVAISLTERLTYDFLNVQVLAGNLRFDKSASVWRWMGPNPADTYG